jgi:hypothetical protein
MPFTHGLLQLPAAVWLIGDHHPWQKKVSAISVILRNARAPPNCRTFATQLLPDHFGVSWLVCHLTTFLLSSVFCVADGGTGLTILRIEVLELDEIARRFYRKAYSLFGRLKEDKISPGDWIAYSGLEFCNTMGDDGTQCRNLT